MTAPFHLPRFYVTAPSPCPYLPDRTERKLFTELHGPEAAAINDALGRAGFRRSQSVAYRPHCPDCNACTSVRVVCDAFKPNATYRKMMRRHDDLIATVNRPWTTTEQYTLLQSYLRARHPAGGMVGMDEVDFADMVEQTPVDTSIIEYREPARHGLPGRLVGACLTDVQADGLSMVYSFYDPDHPERNGLGTYMILDHIRRAQAIGLPYIYLGYWVSGSKSMDYKTRFKPVEFLGPDGWTLLP